MTMLPFDTVADVVPVELRDYQHAAIDATLKGFKDLYSRYWQNLAQQYGRALQDSTGRPSVA